MRGKMTHSTWVTFSLGIPSESDFYAHHLDHVVLFHKVLKLEGHRFFGVIQGLGDR